MSSSVLRTPRDRALATILQNSIRFAGLFPDDTTTDGWYPPRPGFDGGEPGSNHGWTTSFVPGQQWLAWELSENPSFRNAALAHVASFANRVSAEVDLQTHDLGFLYSLSCVVPTVLAPESAEAASAKTAALSAANHLMKRYHQKAGIIQAWGDLSDPEQRGRAIIDSLMNMPLLFWASEQTGESHFSEAATTHVGRLRDTIIREDNTTFHSYHFDPDTGEALRGTTQQGYSDSSCWARGQAWGILGFALNYHHIEDNSLIDASLRCADYYLANLPQDLVPYWDMIFVDGTDQPRDSSSAAIAACGLLELADLVPSRAEEFRDFAWRTAISLAQNYAPTSEESDALLLHSVYSLPFGNGIDEGCLWGDYFYVELLLRLQNPQWQSYWNF